MIFRRSLYHQFLSMVAIFFLFIVGAGLWSLSQWKDEARQKIDATLDKELLRVESILHGDMEKFGMLVPIVRSNQTQLVELAYNDNYTAISYLLKDLSAYFEIDLLLYLTDDGLIEPFLPSRAACHLNLTGRLVY